MFQRFRGIRTEPVSRGLQLFQTSDGPQPDQRGGEYKICGLGYTVTYS